MSKEAVGQNGAVLGSSDYWDRLNRSTYIGTAMQRTSEPEYFEALKRVGQRAASAIDAIYDDLQKSKKAIRNIRLCCGIRLTPLLIRWNRTCSEMSVRIIISRMKPPRF